MSKLSLQLHALPEEVDVLLSDVLNDHSVFVTLAEGSPLQFRLSEEGRCSPECKALTFTLSSPVLPARSVYDFVRLNPDALVFQVGQLTSAGLTESWLAARTENEDALKRWKRVARKVRSATLGGATAVNPATGATAPMTGHRFTIGAQTLYLSGVAMLPVGGNSVVQLPDAAPSQLASPRRSSL
jgi:hypothetical protein